MRSGMKRLVVFGVVLGLGFFMTRGALAHEESGTQQTVKGEVVDLACYLGGGAMGPKHQDCAQKCIASGLPVGIKSGDTVYVVITSEHGPANATLAPLAAKQVVAEGIVTERDGVHLLAIKKITVAKE